MISIEQRILIVFIGLLFSILLTLHNVLKYNSFEVRVFKFIQVLILLFPLIDLKLPPSEMNFKLFDIAILSFSILNFKSLIYSIKNNDNNNFALFFLALLLCLSFLSDFVFDSILNVIRYGLIFIFFLYIKIALSLSRDIFRYFLIPIVLWIILFYVLQLIFGLQFSLYQNINETSLRDLRYTSFCQDPQKLAQLVFMLAIIFLTTIFHNRKLNSRYSLLIVLSCVLIGLSTGSRAPFIGFVIAFMVMFISRINIRSIVVITIFYWFVSFSYEFISEFQIFQRMNDLNSSLEGRMQIFWAKGFMIFTDNFLLGVGPGNFLNYVKVYHNDFTYGAGGELVDQPESGFLLWLCELGIFGTLLLFYILFKSLLKDIRFNNAKPFKLSIIVWLFGFITIYSLSDVKVLFLLLLSVAMVFSSNMSQLNKLN